MKILLFDKEQIYARSYLHANIGERMLMVLCERVQDSYIQGLLSDTLYKDLQQRKIDNTLTTQDVELINNYLLPCFVIKLEMQALVNYNVDFRNLTAGSVIDSQIQPLSVEQMKFYLDAKESELVVVEKVAMDYICKNYANQGEAVSQQRETKTNFEFL